MEHCASGMDSENRIVVGKPDVSQGRKARSFLLYFLQYIISIYNNLIIQITVQYVQHQPHGYSSDIHSLFLQIWKCKKHSSLSPLPVLRT